MSGTALITAIGIVLILEGLLPLIAPRAWRQAFEQLMRFNDGQLRFVGMVLVGVGLLLLWF
jgi:uncharacterized protein